VPDGATPKDGPSAGIAMTTAIVSALTGIPVRADVAMTGEITLRGEVTAIGGLKEKLLAALRGGIKTVLIPEENAKDLQDIPENVKNGLEIVPVKWIDKVLEVALERQPEPLSEDEVQAAAPALPASQPAAEPAPHPVSVKH
jgi:ATP-dependent Lon protease